MKKKKKKQISELYFIYIAYKYNSFVILLPKDTDFSTKLIDCNGSNNWLFYIYQKILKQRNEQKIKKIINIERICFQN